MQKPTFDGAAHNQNGGTAASISVSHVLGKGNFPYVIVAVQSRTTGPATPSIVTGVTYNGVSMHRMDTSGAGTYQSPSQVGAARSQRLALYYLNANELPTAPGTYSVVATLTGSTDCQDIIVASFFNCRQTDPVPLPPVQSIFTSPGGSGTISNAVTTVGQNALVIEVNGCANGSPFSVPAPQTMVVSTTDNGIGGQIELSYLVQEQPATVTMTSTNTNAESMNQKVFYIPFLASPFGGIM